MNLQFQFLKKISAWFLRRRKDTQEENTFIFFSSKKSRDRLITKSANHKMINHGIDHINQLIAALHRDEQTAADIAKLLPHSASQHRAINQLIQFTQSRRNFFLKNHTHSQTLENKIHHTQEKINAFDLEKSFTLISQFLSCSPAFSYSDLHDIKKLSRECERMTSRAVILSARHKKMEEILQGDLTPSTYLSDLTPSSIKKLYNAVDELAELIDQTGKLSHLTVQRAEIKTLRYEIALSMYERLCIAQKKCWFTPADIIADQLYESHCDAYLLSHETIYNYFNYIEKWGDVTLQRKLRENFGSCAKVMNDQIAPFYSAMQTFMDARQPTEIDRAVNDILAVSPWISKENIQLSLMPRQVINSEWSDNIQRQKKSLEYEKIKIIALSAKIKSCENRVARLQKNFFQYEKASITRKFLMTFFGRGGAGQRQAELTEAKKLLAETNAHRLTLKTNYHDVKNKFKKQVAQITHCIISRINDDLQQVDAHQKPTITKIHIQSIRQFIAEHDATLLPILNQKLDIVASFLSALQEGVETQKLNSFAYLIAACDEQKDKPANRIISFLQGEQIYDTLQQLQTDFASLMSLPSDELAFDGFLQCIQSNYFTPALEKILAQLSHDSVNGDTSLIQTAHYLLLFYSQTEKENFFEKIKSHINNRIATRFKKINAYDENCFLQDDAFYRTMDSILQKHHAPFTARSLLNQQFSERTICVSPWNRHFSTLVENYAHAEMVERYRIMRLTELLQYADFDLSREHQENAFLAFLYSCTTKSHLAGSVVLSAVQNNFLEEIVHNSKACWMHESIIKNFGTCAQLQEMHCLWIESLLHAIDNGKSNAGHTEYVLRILMEKITDLESLAQFIGEKNKLRMHHALIKMMNVMDATLLVPVIYLSGPTNKMAVSREQIDNMLCLLGSSVIQNLLRCFAPDTKTSDDYAVLCKRWMSQRCLNVMTKQFYELISHAINAEGFTQEQVIDMAFIQTVLLQRPQDRHRERAGRIEVLLSLRNSADKNASLNFFNDQILWELDYSTHPDIFYTHHGLPLLEYCHQLLATTSDLQNELYTKKIISIIEVVLESIFLFDARHVDPLLHFIKKSDTNDLQDGEWTQLKNTLLRLSKPYTCVDAYHHDRAYVTACITQHHLCSDAIALYLQSCDQLKLMREKLQHINSQFREREQLKLSTESARKKYAICFFSSSDVSREKTRITEKLAKGFEPSTR